MEKIKQAVNLATQSRRGRIATVFSFLLAAVLGIGIGGILFFDDGQPAKAGTPIQWNGDGDGSSWNDADNWDLDRTPLSGDDVFIDDDVTVNIAAGVTIESLTLGNGSGTTAPILNFTYDAIGTADPIEITVAGLTINTNASVDHSSGTSAVVGSIYFDVTGGNIIVDGSIDLEADGYDEEEGTEPGGAELAGNVGGGGGGHGGEGGAGDGSTQGTKGLAGDGGTVYGSITAPVTYGSGGANSISSLAGDGGGAVRLDATNNLDIDGSISVNGEDAPNGSRQPGGGAAGSVYVTVGGTLSGTGSISADGGLGDGRGGGGGGGRISLTYDTDSSSITTTAYGGGSNTGMGSQGGAGTIYLNNTGSGVDELIIDNNNQEPSENDDRFLGRTPLTPSGTPLSFSVDNLTIRNDGNLDLNSDTTLTVNTSTTWNSAGTITDNGGTFALLSGGGSLTIPSGSILFANTARTYTGLTVSAGAELTHSNNNTTGDGQLYDIDFTVNGNVTIDGSVDLLQRGYDMQEGPGAGNPETASNNGAGGGGHGGEGGAGDGSLQNTKGGTGDGGIIYGSITAPVTVGSGGEDSISSEAGHGGGAISLDIDGDLDIDGTITVDGSEAPEDNRQAAGGAGGSVYLDATGTLTGTGTISADGGLGDGRGGGGGGGRISLTYATDSSSITSTAYGGGSQDGMGSQGGAGTIYLNNTGSGVDELIIDNNNQEPSENDDRFLGRTPLTPSGTPLSITVDNLTIRNDGNLDLNSDTTLTVNTSTTWSSAGTITDNGGTFALLSGGGSLTIPSGAILFANTARTYTGLTVSAGAELTHSNNDTTGAGQLYDIDFTVNGNVTIDGTVDLYQRGYDMQEGPGAGDPELLSNVGAGGGGHGGEGGAGDGSLVGTKGVTGDGGDVYGSVTAPVTVGSGGEDSITSEAGHGGGAIALDIDGDLDIDGTITVDGSEAPEDNRQAAGGAGGSVYLDATGTLTGTGSISADGGLGDGRGGGGGGGRISLAYDTDSSSITTTAYGGGSQDGMGSQGGAGTIYLNNTGSGVDELIIDNNNQEPSENDDRFIGRTPLTPSGTPLSITVDNLTIRNDGNLDLNSDTTLTVNTSTTWSSAGTITDNGGTFVLLSGGGSLTIPSGGILFANATRTYTGLTVSAGAELTHSNNDTTGAGQLYDIDFTVNGNVTIDGTVDLDQRGYDMQEGPGAGDPELTSNAGAGGGGHGGEGGAGDGNLPSIVGLTGDGGDVYGSVTAPVTVGSGGEDSITSEAGHGGGAIALDIDGDLDIDGTVTVDGSEAPEDNRQAAGGSAGSVYLDATGTLTGTGSISADGGLGDGRGGGGGGGRVSLTYNADSSSVTTTAYGGGSQNGIGSQGGAGTIYLNNTGSGVDELIIDNNNQEPSENDDRFLGRTPLTPSGTPLSITVDNLTIRNDGNLDLNSDTTLTVNTSTTWNSNGIITDNGGTFAEVTSGALSVPSGATLFANTTRTLTSVTIVGTLTHSSNTDTQVYDIDLTTSGSGNVTISSGGTVDLRGRGYTNQEGTGAGIDAGFYGSGAGHGGVGGDTNDGGSTGGSTYGSSSAPVTIGSGGGNDGNNRGSRGGGAVHLTAGGDFLLDGDIIASADDAVELDGGGGSGGSIYLEIAGAFSGSGDLFAEGGDAEEDDAGAGGGGRIAATCGSSTWSGTDSVIAGTLGFAGGDGTSEICAPAPPAEVSYGDVSAEFSRLRDPTVSDVDINFTTTNALSAGTIITVDFPVEFTSPTAPTGGSGLGTGPTFGTSGNDFTATCGTGGCSAGTISITGGTITTPATPATYIITITNDENADTASVAVPIVDDDQVTVTANVDSTIVFDIDTALTDTDSNAPYTVDLGTITASDTRVSGSTDSINFIWLDIQSNSSNGMIVTVQNANGANGLVSTSVGTDAIESSGGLLADGSEEYGMCVVSTSASTGTLQTLGDYASPTACTANGETNDVEVLSTTATSIFDSDDAPITAGRAQIAVGSSVSSITPAHPDYTDTITFIGTVRY